jgi:hypothetical protein
VVVGVARVVGDVGDMVVIGDIGVTEDTWFTYIFSSRHLELTPDQTVVNLSLRVQSCYNLSYD